MANRCESCSKFVSLENEEPQVDRLDVEFDGDDNKTIKITAEVTCNRNCAECGQTMTSISYSELKHEFSIEEMEGWGSLNKDDEEALIKDIDMGAVSLEVSEAGSSQEEGGGGRYKKNMIEMTLDADVTLSWGARTLTFSHQFKEETAASGYDEQ